MGVGRSGRDVARHRHEICSRAPGSVGSGSLHPPMLRRSLRRVRPGGSRTDGRDTQIHDRHTQPPAISCGQSGETTLTTQSESTRGKGWSTHHSTDDEACTRGVSSVEKVPATTASHERSRLNGAGGVGGAPEEEGHSKALKTSREAAQCQVMGWVRPLASKTLRACANPTTPKAAFSRQLLRALGWRALVEMHLGGGWECGAWAARGAPASMALTARGGCWLGRLAVRSFKGGAFRRDGVRVLAEAWDGPVCRARRTTSHQEKPASSSATPPHPANAPVYRETLAKETLLEKPSHAYSPLHTARRSTQRAQGSGCRPAAVVTVTGAAAVVGVLGARGRVGV